MSITLEKAKEKYNLTGKEYDNVADWYNLSYYPLPEELIREAVNKVNWRTVSRHSKLSEVFIEEFKDKLDWECISKHQKLSENFIKKFKDKVNWRMISMCQKLSESFIQEMQDYVFWSHISKFQSLTEKFIKEFANKVDWTYIARHQVVSRKFLEEFGYELLNNSDKPESYWKRKVQKTGLYECHEDYFYAYKGIRNDRYSCYNFQYQYLPGETYECFSDYSDDDASFGLSVWTKREIECYYDESVIVRVKIYYRDVTAVIRDAIDDTKIRCKKLTVLE